MNFQKFVAWDKLPTLYHEADTQESSSSSSKTGNVEEEESEILQNAQDTESMADMTIFPIEIPHSVKNVLNKIDTAQLERAKKDISKKLLHIREKVNRVYEHYKKDDAFDADLEKEYFRTATWEEKSRRSNLLDEITDSLDQSAFKEKELQSVLESLKAWSEMMRTIELQEKVIPSEDWIEDAEKSLLKHFHAIQKNILYLIKMCYPILHEREKKRQQAALRAGIFKAWRDKVAEKPQLAEPLTAEQMVEDEVLTFSRTHEINEMILEMAGLSFFNKGEVNAIKYIAAMVANLTKAFGLLSRQGRSLKIKLEVGAAESRKQDPQVTSLQRELRMIIEKKAALEMQVQNAEERCKVLLTTNEAMQKELRSAHERAQMSKTSLSRSPLSRVSPENAKSQVDIEKDASKTVPVKQLPTLPPTASKVPGMETEESSRLEEARKLKYKSEDSGTEKLVSAASMTQSQTLLVQDTQIKMIMKFQEEETAPQIVPQKSPEETALLEKRTGLDLKSLTKTQLQKSQLPAAKSVTESHLSQSSRAGSQESIQEITSEGEPSTQSSGESVRSTSIKEDIKLSAKKPLSESPAEKTQRPSIQWDGQPTEPKPSLKRSVKKVVQAIRLQKRVKFQINRSPRGSLTTPDRSEKLDAELPEGSPLQKPLTGTAENIESESQDAGKMQAQSQQIAKLKEKKEMKGSRSMLVEKPRPRDSSEKEAEKRKEAKIIRDVIHELGTQLQEIAREKGGVIEEKTIKELFKELDETSEDDLSGQRHGSLPEDKLAKVLVVKRPELLASASERLSKPRESIDEAPSGQDVKSAVQEFQASILACIEDKMENLKRFPSESLKQPKKSKPINPQVQHLYQAIDRKLDECFSEMKQKYRRAMMRHRFSSLGSEEEEKESKLRSPLGTPPALSQDSSVSSLSTPEEGGEQQLAPKHRTPSKQRLKQRRDDPAVVQDQPTQQEKRVDSPKYQLPKEEKKFRLPDVVLRVQELRRQAKQPQQAEMPSLVESGSEHGLWFMHLQERLEWEKGRLQDEQSRLQEERLRLADEEQYLGHWQDLFEMQQEQWNQQRQQQLEQELLWVAQVEYWQQLKQDHEEQQQYWWLQQEQHEERLQQLQEELQKLQRQYEQQLLLQKEQTEEQGRWDRLRVWREEQLHAWREEDEEREKQRSLWQQQLADHEKQLSVWQQEKAEQELQFKKWQEKQQQELQAQESFWQQRIQRQQQQWQRQVQRHQIQQRKQQTQLQKVQERQKQIRNEEKVLAPQLRMLRTRDEGELAKESQWQEPREPSPTKLEPPIRKVQLLPTPRMDQLLPATRKTGLLPTTPQLSPESSDEYLDAFDLDSTLFSKSFPRDDGFPAYGVTESRYSLKVDAQRKNLELLEEANQKVGLAPDLYIKVKETITQALHSNAERLALLFQKYIAFCRLQKIRQTVTAWLDAAKDDKDGAKMKKLYGFVGRLDAYQRKVLDNWTSSQKIVEKKRQHNIENMIVLFDKLHLNYRLQLSPPCPVMIKAAGTTKETQLPPHIGPVYLRPRVYRSPLCAMKKPVAFSAIVRDEGSEQIESLWQTGITELSIPLGPKTPVSLLWSQPCGFPDIPRLLEFDITSLRNKPLQEIKTRVQSIPRWKISEYKFMHL
ncbi:UNVERIFIED_CONTAM: hypothetical protein K2H54_038049 [Gekko kuhli]